MNITVRKNELFDISSLPMHWRAKVVAMMEAEELSVELPRVGYMLLHNLVIILLTLFGNLVLVYVILKNNRVLRRKRVTPVQKLMLHMCAADLLFAFITMVPSLGITATVPIFHGPDVLCKFVKFLQVIPMYASSFLLVAISADRYQAICRPLASMRSGSAHRPSFYASIAWISALLMSSPQLALFEKRDEDCVTVYTSDYQYMMYVTMFNVIVWLLPSAFAGCLYYCVCRAVCRSTVVCNDKEPKQECLVPSSAGMLVHYKGGSLQGDELNRRRVQTVRLTLTIVASNFLLWAPFCVTSVIDAVWPNAINATFATYIMFFGNLNSCMNPWIWFYFNRSQIERAFACFRRAAIINRVRMLISEYKKLLRKEKKMKNCSGRPTEYTITSDIPLKTLN